MTLEEARTWLASGVAQRYLQGIDEAADDALEASTRNIRGMAAFPSGDVSEIRTAATALERAQGEFNTEVNLVSLGRARDGRAVAQACRRYVAALVTLEEMNARHGAFVEARVAEFAAAFAADYIRRSTALRRRFQETLQALEGLRDALNRASSSVEEAELQRNINVVLTVVTALIPEVGIPARIAIATASVLGQVLLDEALGPTGATGSGTATNAVGSFSGFLPTASRLIPRFVGAAANVISFSSDTDEIAAAQRIVRDIEARLNGLMRSLPELERQVRADTGDMDTARALYEGAARRARSLATAYRSSEGEYRALLRELSGIR